MDVSETIDQIQIKLPKPNVRQMKYLIKAEDPSLAELVVEIAKTWQLIWLKQGPNMVPIIEN